jgi:hypothetical protein
LDPNENGAPSDFLADRFVHEGVTVPLKASERDKLLLDMYGRVVRVEAKIEALPDHENRIRKIEKLQWGFPATLLVALFSLVGIH